MQKICFAICLALSAVGTVMAADNDGAGAVDQGAPVRFASLRNLWAQPAGAMYSMGGYAPAGSPGCGCNNNTHEELDSPCGCAGIWGGYQARPCCRHRHYSDSCGAGTACGGCGSTCGVGRGWGGCGSSCGIGRGWGGYGGGWGGGPIVTGALGCGCGCSTPCATGCNTCGRHHCPLFGHHCRRSACGCDTQVSSCGCGAQANYGDSLDGSPSDNNGPSLSPTPAPENVKPGPQEPGPSAGRRFRPFTAFNAAAKETR